MDFRFVGRYSITDIDFVSTDTNGDPVATDAPPVAEFHDYSTDTLMWTRSTTNIPTVGMVIYRLVVSSVESATPGLYYILWNYSLGGIPQQFRTDVEIPQNTSTVYADLIDGYRSIVDNAWSLFEDLYDSAIGGPHLQMYAQSKFGRERVAQLMVIALGKMNTFSQPHQSYGLDLGSAFPFTEWGPLLAQMTHVEVIKHLMRSYVEQPDAQGVEVARLDRRDYLARWQTILDNEQADLVSALGVFKIAAMNLGRSSILVSGGLYGTYPVRGNPAIRPRSMPGFVR